VSGKRASQIRSTHSCTAGLTRDPIDCWSRGDGTPSSLAARVITCSVEGGRGRCAWTNYRSWTGQALRIMDRCDPRVMSQSYNVKVFGRRAAPSRAANARRRRSKICKERNRGMHARRARRRLSYAGFEAPARRVALDRLGARARGARSCAAFEPLDDDYGAAAAWTRLGVYGGLIGSDGSEVVATPPQDRTLPPARAVDNCASSTTAIPAARAV
jgi:hypothetical protein